MARQRIGGTKVQVLVPDDVLGAIDDRGVKRSEFIREAILEKLGDAKPAIAERAVKPVKCEVSEPAPEKRVRPKKNFDGQAVVEGLRPDAAVLLEAVRGKRMTSRDAERSMGWMGLRYSKAEKQLISSGLVRFEGGVLVAEVEA